MRRFFESGLILLVLVLGVMGWVPQVEGQESSFRTWKQNDGAALDAVWDGVLIQLRSQEDGTTYNVPFGNLSDEDKKYVQKHILNVLGGKPLEAEPENPDGGEPGGSPAGTPPAGTPSTDVPPVVPPKPSELKPGERMVKTADGVEYAFRWCPAGKFMMGSPGSESSRYDDEGPRHEVTLTKGFWMLETEVTQAMWKSVTGDNPSHFKGDNLPVENVSWDDCQKFCRKLSSKIGLEISLPTEAQWEYACRAGTITPFSFGSTLNGDNANCDGNYPYGTSTNGQYLQKTAPVKSYAPNAWGLYDMHGNVWEWCQDWKDDYPSGSVTDPTGPNSGSSRVLRGGCWVSLALSCRSVSRSRLLPDGRNDVVGFRVVGSAQ